MRLYLQILRARAVMTYFFGLTTMLHFFNISLGTRPRSAQCWNTFSRVSAAMGDSSAVRDAQGMSYVLGLGRGGNQTY